MSWARTEAFGTGVIFVSTYMYESSTLNLTLCIRVKYIGLSHIRVKQIGIRLIHMDAFPHEEKKNLCLRINMTLALIYDTLLNGTQGQGGLVNFTTYQHLLGYLTLKWGFNFYYTWVERSTFVFIIEPKFKHWPWQYLSEQWNIDHVYISVYC